MKEAKPLKFNYHKHLRASLPGCGIAFKNQYKNDPKHPDFLGTITAPSGEILTLNAYSKTNSRGESYLTFTLMNVMENNNEHK